MDPDLVDLRSWTFAIYLVPHLLERFPQFGIGFELKCDFEFLGERPSELHSSGNIPDGSKEEMLNSNTN